MEIQIEWVFVDRIPIEWVFDQEWVFVDRIQIEWVFVDRLGISLMEIHIEHLMCISLMRSKYTLKYT